MDINKFIDKKAGEDNDHDKHFREALIDAHDRYKDLGIRELDEAWDRAKFRNAHAGGTHVSVADCLILYELFGEALVA